MPFPITHKFRALFRIRNALIALALAIIFGTIGFTLIEGWPLSQSLYVTVQTLTTVGYGDVPPHTGAGRAFAVIVDVDGCRRSCAGRLDHSSICRSIGNRLSVWSAAPIKKDAEAS